VEAKPLARELGLRYTGPADAIQPHPLNNDRRAPMRRLMAKLGLTEFRNVGPLEDRLPPPRRVVLPLKQHAGAPAQPVLTVGARVRTGDLLARPGAGALGACIHASIDGTVTAIADAVTINA
jgi:Na+-translocating ferredoxin:NAD+ oxidoreductase RnfC subunit